MSHFASLPQYPHLCVVEFHRAGALHSGQRVTEAELAEDGCAALTCAASAPSSGHGGQSGQPARIWPSWIPGGSWHSGRFKGLQVCANCRPRRAFPEGESRTAGLGCLGQPLCLSISLWFKDTILGKGSKGGNGLGTKLKGMPSDSVVKLSSCPVLESRMQKKSTMNKTANAQI